MADPQERPANTPDPAPEPPPPPAPPAPPAATATRRSRAQTNQQNPRTSLRNIVRQPRQGTDKPAKGDPAKGPAKAAKSRATKLGQKEPAGGLPRDSS